MVYAVTVETGLNREDIGKLILTACFVTDLGTVLALGELFATYDLLLVESQLDLPVATIRIAG